MPVIVPGCHEAFGGNRLEGALASHRPFVRSLVLSLGCVSSNFESFSELKRNPFHDAKGLRRERPWCATGVRCDLHFK